jgi:hypothetical protein
MSFLGLCEDDPIIKTLRDVFGQNIIRVPEERYRLLAVLAARDDKAYYRGSLPPLITGEPFVLDPALVADSRMVNIAGRRSRIVDLDLGVQILEGFLSGIGVPPAGVKAKFEGVTKVSFRFEDVVRKWVDINSVGALLQGRKVDSANPAAAIFFGDEEYSFLVLDSVITSTDFTIAVERSSSVDFRLDVPAFEELVGNASVGVSVSSSNHLDLTFKGTRQLAFAFSCVRFALTDDGTIRALVPEAEVGALHTRDARHPAAHAPRYSADRVLLTAVPALIDIE